MKIHPFALGLLIAAAFGCAVIAAVIVVSFFITLVPEVNSNFDVEIFTSLFFSLICLFTTKNIYPHCKKAWYRYSCFRGRANVTTRKRRWEPSTVIKNDSTRNHCVYVIHRAGEVDMFNSYIGVTKNFHRRCDEHFEQLKIGKHKNHNLVREYQSGKLMMSPIATRLTKLQAYDKEHQLRPRWKIGWNVAPGGMRGVHF
ncbi:GIY-YIG nuclease family protein [Vibrio sp. PNB23_22_7]